MLVRISDRLVDWINVGSRRTLVTAFSVSGLVLAPFWLTLSAYLLIRCGLLQENRFDLLWMPVAVGTAGCLLLPIEHLSTRILVAIAYAPVSAVLLMGFHLVVGCLLIGSCL